MCIIFFSRYDGLRRNIYNNKNQTIKYKHNAGNQRVAKLINGEVVEKYHPRSQTPRSPNCVWEW